MITRTTSQRERLALFFLLATIFLTSPFGTSSGECANSSVTVAARAVPSQATLGQEIRLLVQVEHPQAFSVVVPDKIPSLTPFEVKKVELSPVVLGKNRVRETLVLTLTAFQLGDLQVPSFGISYKDSQGRVDQVFTEAVSIKIVSVIKKKDDKQDIRPIKGPVKISLRAIYSFGLVMTTILLTALLVVKIVLRRRKRLADLESLKPPHERALLEMGRLRERRFLEDGKYKEFYSELSDILRRYLERRFEAHAPEQTSVEILMALKEKKLESLSVQRVKDILETSDLVKFAKFLPSRSQTESLTQEMIEFVESTKLPDAVPKGGVK